MSGFPLFLSTKHEDSIKNVIAKNIKDFYRAKGTEKSYNFLFQLLFN